MTSEASFLKDVASHEMTVIQDDGLYRHIRFKQPGSGHMYFDLITWPGVLCYTGDMGTYVFKRLDDMFQFFRTDRRDNGKLNINLGYWSEKLQASNCSGRHCRGVMEFSYDRYERIIKEQLVSWWRDECCDAEERRQLREAVEEALLDNWCECPESVESAIRMASNFSATISGYTYQFRDFWDHRLEDYSFHFIWCCYALAWGIEKYDAAKAIRHEPEAS